MTLKLIQKIFVQGLIITRTGLSIGGTDTGLGITGADRLVVRDPLTNAPYIPGSTLKGRMRSLMERMVGEFGPTPGGGFGGPIRKPETDAGRQLCLLFGLPADDKAPLPTRLTIRDAHLVNRAKLAANRDLDLPFTELKTEATIDRITAKATPHHYERVPAGAVFGLDAVLTVFEHDGKPDNPAELVNQFLGGLRLIQDDSLGACGSRGYGKVTFHLQPLTYKDAAAYISGAPAKPFDAVAVPDDLRHTEAEKVLV